MSSRRRRRMTDAKKKRAQARAKRTLRRRRRLEAQARAQGTTQFGFLLPAGALAREIRLREKIRAIVSMRKSPLAKFQTEDLLVGLSVAQLAGLRRIDHMPLLAKEIALAEELGLPHWFGETTARDFLEMASDMHIEEMRELLRQIAYERAVPDAFGWLHVSVDSSVLPAWPSRKEGVAPGSGGGNVVGLCHKFTRVTIEDLPCDFALHAGNRNPFEMGQKGLEHAVALARLHPQAAILFTADAGYSSTDGVDAMMDLARRHRNFHFVQAVPRGRFTGPDQLVAEAKALTKRAWVRINKRTSVCDLGNRKLYENSSTYPRVVVCRRIVQKYRGPKGRRYKVSVPEYELLATDFTKSDASARTVFARYHSRQEIEASIRDSKQSLPLRALPSHHFRANHFFLAIVSLAQLLHALLRRRLWPGLRSWGRTLLRDLYAIPGRKLSKDRWLLAAPYHRWRRALHAARLTFTHFGLRLSFPTP